MSVLAWMPDPPQFETCGRCNQRAPTNQMLPIAMPFDIVKWCHAYKCPSLQEKTT